MGYKNERATINQYSSLEEYARKHVSKTISEISSISTARDMEVKLLKPSFEYCPSKEELRSIPMASVDGGIATIFSGELTETKILRVAAGCAESFSEEFGIKKYQTFTHLYSGKLKWPEGANQTLENVIEENVDILLANPFIIQAVNVLELSLGDLRQALINQFIRLRGKSIEDNFREILELSMMVCFLDDQKKLRKEFLLVKDGTLFPSKTTSSSLFSEKVAEYFSEPQPVLGVIKSSRFVNRENAWSKMVINYAKEVKSHTFFRVPKRVELMVDPNSDNIPFNRFFLSLFGGESIYEVQIPKKAGTKDDVKPLLQALASQITFSYGGSLVVNSYAHEEASLSEAEANYLTEDLRSDLEKLKQLQKESKDPKGEENE
jgi:hypothetical protein